MQHPQPGDTIEVHVVPDSIIKNVKVVEWEEDWIRVSEPQTTPAGIIYSIYTIRVQHIIRYALTTVSAAEKDRTVQPIPEASHSTLNKVEAELVDKVKSLAELKIEQRKAKMASIRDFLPEKVLTNKKQLTYTDKYELPSFKKYTKDET